MSSPLPPEFEKRLRALVPPEKHHSFYESFFAPRAVAVRVNTLKSTPEAAGNTLEQAAIAYTVPSWYPDAFILDVSSVRTVTDLPLYQAGGLYIQSLSSMIPPLVLDPQPQDNVLDMTAAPGSKTTQLAALMHNKGQIIANDLNRSRIYKLKANLKQQGVTNTTVICQPGQTLWKHYPEYFDKVLLDAPCSMEGRLSTLDPSSLHEWSRSKISRMARLQKWLLRSAVSCAKVGGIIVYSTCTLAPEENQEVIDWILEKEKGNVELEVVSLFPERSPGFILGRSRGEYTTPAVTAWQGRPYTSEVSKTLRVLPSATMEGFFIAKLRKIRSNVVNNG